jgi:hypothetical protein
MNDGRTRDARAAIEHVINEYQDVLIVDDDSKMHMPVLNNWILITSHDDAVDPTILATHRLCRENQATHETVGLLILACDEMRSPGYD